MADYRIQNERQREIAIEALKALDLTRPFVMTLKRRATRRSLNQNALFHKWVGEIATETGESFEGVKDALKQEFLAPRLVTLGDVTREVRPSTADLTVPEMAEFMTQVQALAGRMGWFLTHPEDMYAEAMR